MVLISNCPQLNNPCNGWNPTPRRGAGMELTRWQRWRLLAFRLFAVRADRLNHTPTRHV
ncbi:hypothetical protein LNP26_25115 [Klebsiella variicola subsp. variicola]|nr:hypothetical protein [Klebsiella variicola subsp. variicola]